MTLQAPSGSVIIQCVLGGPLIVRGPHIVKSETGAVIETGRYVALCRCSRSNSYPICDGCHAAGP
jgi:CDGSH-type Zn-finger protein